MQKGGLQLGFPKHRLLGEQREKRGAVQYGFLVSGLWFFLHLIFLAKRRKSQLEDCIFYTLNLDSHSLPFIFLGSNSPLSSVFPPFLSPSLSSVPHFSFSPFLSYLFCFFFSSFLSPYPSQPRSVFPSSAPGRQWQDRCNSPQFRFTTVLALTVSSNPNSAVCWLYDCGRVFRKL